MDQRKNSIEEGKFLRINSQIYNYYKDYGNHEYTKTEQTWDDQVTTGVQKASEHRTYFLWPFVSRRGSPRGVHEGPRAPTHLPLAHYFYYVFGCL